MSKTNNKFFNGINSTGFYTAEGSSQYLAGSENIQVGHAATITGNETADLGADGGTLLGKVITRSDKDIIVVQERGVVVLQTAALIAAGEQSLGVDGTGKVKVSAGKKIRLVRSSWTEGGEHWAKIDLG